MHKLKHGKDSENPLFKTKQEELIRNISRDKQKMINLEGCSNVMTSDGYIKYLYSFDYNKSPIKFILRFRSYNDQDKRITYDTNITTLERRFKEKYKTNNRDDQITYVEDNWQTIKDDPSHNKMSKFYTRNPEQGSALGISFELHIDEFLKYLVEKGFVEDYTRYIHSSPALQSSNPHRPDKLQDNGQGEKNLSHIDSQKNPAIVRKIAVIQSANLQNKDKVNKAVADSIIENEQRKNAELEEIKKLGLDIFFLKLHKMNIDTAHGSVMWRPVIYSIAGFIIKLLYYVITDEAKTTGEKEDIK